ncbi:MAG TPA: host attachment protein [Gammaproteobacteria bacterium]|nr:host attachment protein [Gammaproteobacteria bacterium]
MSDYCVIAVDGSRARFFTLVPAAQPEVESGPNLVEDSEALINTETDMSGKEKWSDMKTGRNMSNGGQAHGYDDHRDQHDDEFKRRFAKQVAGEAVRFAQAHNARHLVIAAEKRMLGFLRETLKCPPKAGFTVSELAKDVSWLSPHDIHALLAKDNLLPPRRAPRG